MANKEQLSALTDNELHESSLLEQLSNDAEAAQEWSRYHLIGDVMRGDVPKSIDLNIADKVAEALEQEPAIVAPKPQAEKQTWRENPRVVRLFKYAGQYAVAASVAVAAIVGVQQYSANPENGDPLPVFNTIPVGGAVAPVSLQSAPQPRELTEAEVMEQHRRINAYLQDHRFQQRIVE